MEKNNDYDKVMRDAQYRKSRSIAFFSCTNAAIELLKFKGQWGTFEKDDDSIKKELIFWRDTFLAEYTKDYAENIANIGLEKVDPKVIQGLDEAKKAYESKQ